MARQMTMRVALNENDRWEVQYSYAFEGSERFAFEPGSPDFATKSEAILHMDDEMGAMARESAAEHRYASQIAFACGERE